MSKPLEVTIEQDRATPRVVLKGELDLASAEQLTETLRPVEASAPPTLVLDLRQLEFMDSTGLRALLAANGRAGDRGGKLVVVRGPEEVDRVLRITRMDHHLELVDEPPEP